MTRLGRYWLFFVIVAVGLALSWGQVGRKTHQVLEVEPVTYLQTEANCEADLEPCAAVAGDHALVLGPVPGGLHLKQTGFVATEIISVKAAALPDASATAETPIKVEYRQAGWSISLPSPSSTVRIRVATSGRVSVADFPLSRDQ